MSSLLMAFVSKMVMMKVGRKIIVPMISSIQLLRVRWNVRMYVTAAAIAEDRRIFAEETQSTVTL